MALEAQAWATVFVAVGTPVLAFLGAVFGQLLTRKGAKEDDVVREVE